jgi:hypothetical protein
VAVAVVALVALVVMLRRVLLAVAGVLLALAAPLAIPASLARRLLMLAVAAVVVTVQPHILYRVLAVVAVARVADQEPAWELVGVQLLTQVLAAAVVVETVVLAVVAAPVLSLFVIQTHTAILPGPAAS